MKKFKLSLLAVLSVFLINACGDDDDSNPANGNGDPAKDDITNTEIFTETEGDWWLFDNYEIDSDGNRKGASYVDTVKITGTEFKDGQNAIEFTTIDTDGNISGTRYYYSTGDEVYIHKDFVNLAIAKYGGAGLELPFEIKQNWIKIADKTLNEWTSYTEDIGQVKISDLITVQNGTLTLKGFRGEDANIDFNGTSIRCHEFILEIKFVGYFEGDPEERTLKFEIQNWFGDDSGILLTTYDTGTFDVGLGDPILLAGRESKALEINVQ